MPSPHRLGVQRFAMISTFAILLLQRNAPAAQPVPGTYDLFFYKIVSGDLVAVETLPVCTETACEELILNARVTDGTLPAQGGIATFQYCSYKGLPPNDITRADEAPSSACEDGSAVWKSLATLPVDQSGNAYYDFGIVRIPRTVGFRFKYLARGSGIEKATSLPEDFVWTAAE
jgi:hypothetical protein